MALPETLAPKPFGLDSTECAESWMFHFECWTNFHAWDDKKKLLSFPLFLDKSARLWFEELPAEQRSTYGKAKDSFMKQYFQKELCQGHNLWPDLWTEKTADETLEEYFTRKRQLCLQLGNKIDDNFRRQIYISGLPPEHKYAVIVNDCKTPYEIEHHAKIIDVVERLNAHDPRLQGTTKEAETDSGQQEQYIQTVTQHGLLKKQETTQLQDRRNLKGSQGRCDHFISQPTNVVSDTNTCICQGNHNGSGSCTQDLHVNGSQSGGSLSYMQHVHDARSHQSQNNIDRGHSDIVYQDRSNRHSVHQGRQLRHSVHQGRQLRHSVHQGRQLRHSAHQGRQLRHSAHQGRQLGHNTHQVIKSFQNNSHRGKQLGNNGHHGKRFQGSSPNSQGLRQTTQFSQQKQNIHGNSFSGKGYKKQMDKQDRQGPQQGKQQDSSSVFRTDNKGDNTAKSQQTSSKTKQKSGTNFPFIAQAGSLNRKQSSDCTVQVRIGKSALKGLLDTGATISVISQSQLTKANLGKDVTVDKTTLSHVMGVNGTSIPVLGIVTLPIEIGSLTLHHQFHILERVSHPLILGMDFLTEQEGDISLITHTLKLQKGMIEVPIGSSENYDNTRLVRLVSEITIPARTEVITAVKTKPVDQVMNIGVIDSYGCLPDKCSVVGARCLVEIVNNRTTYRLLNPTNNDVTLKAEQIVGHFKPIPEEDILGDLETELDNENLEEVNILREDKLSDDDYIKIAQEMDIDFSNSELTEDQKRKLLILLGQNRDTFAKDISELGMCSDKQYMHHIDTGDATPIRKSSYRASPAMKKIISDKIDEMLKTGIIEPSTTTWLSPVVLVKKKSGELRFCLDYRALNSVTKPIHFPLPHLEEVFDTIAESKSRIFSTLDLLSGYFQIPLDPETKHKTGFISHRGVHQFNRLPFGLTNGPASFQMMMASVLRDMMWKFALAYVDDVLIFSQTFDEHLSHLQAVFNKLNQANLRLKPSKCCFAARQVRYLGHILSKEGIQVDPEKTSAVQSFPRPKNIKDIRSFLGLCNYYRKFVRNFSMIAAPLTRLLKKNTPFEWTEDCEKAFTNLKNALLRPPILTFPDFNKDFLLYTDASKEAIGYILGQFDDSGKEVVIAYGGRSLHPNEKNWHITELECLALVEAIKQYHVYLANSHFTVYTDHIALSYLKNMKCNTPRIQRWALFLQQYNMNITYKAGKKHWNADALSRRTYTEQPTATANTVDNDSQHMSGEQPTIHQTTNVSTLDKLAQAEQTYQQLPPVAALQEVISISEADLRQMQLEDRQLSPYIKFLEDDELPEDGKLASRIRSEQLSFQMTDGVLYHLYAPRGKGSKATREVKQLCVPHKVRDDILRSYHDALGHQGQDRTQRAIIEKYYWPRMQTDIEYYVKSCEDCQKAKRHFHGKQAPLKPLPVGDTFSRLHMDIIGPLTKSPEGFEYILLMVCPFTKWCEAFPLKTTTADVIAEVLYSEIICRYGPPREILTDQGQNFKSQLIAEVCRRFQITKLQTSSYHPQTNSACERMNSVLEQAMRTYCDDRQTNWPKVLPSILHAYRTTPATESTGFSPFYMLFLREPSQPIDTALLPQPTLKKNVRTYIEDLKERMTITHEIARDNITAAQLKYSTQHNKKAAPPQFERPNRVWLFCSKKQPGLSPKLTKKWTGPYYICIDYGNNTYKLRRESDHHLVKSVVHANRLKPYNDPADRPTNPPMEEKDDDLNAEELDDQEDTQQAHQQQHAKQQQPGTAKQQHQPGTAKQQQQPGTAKQQQQSGTAKQQQPGTAKQQQQLGTGKQQQQPGTAKQQQQPGTAKQQQQPGTAKQQQQPGTAKQQQPGTAKQQHQPGTPKQQQHKRVQQQHMGAQQQHMGAQQQHMGAQQQHTGAQHQHTRGQKQTQCSKQVQIADYPPLPRDTIKRISSSSRHKGYRTYYVIFNNGRQSDSFYEFQLPTDLVRDFHSRRTLSGRIRKRPPINRQRENEKLAVITSVAAFCAYSGRGVPKNM